MLEVVHDRALDLHRSVLPHALPHEFLDEGLYEAALRIVAQVSGVGSGLVVDELEFPHQADMGRFLFRLAGLRHLV